MGNKTTIKIKITTPKGEAKKAELKLRPFILGTFTIPKDWYINKDNSAMVWIVECDVRKSIAITTKVNLYQSAIKWAFKSKPVKWAMKKATRKDQETVKDMINNGTKIEVMKVADAEAWEQYQKPLWKRLKEKVFKDEKKEHK